MGNIIIPVTNKRVLLSPPAMYHLPPKFEQFHIQYIDGTVSNIFSV